MLVLFVIKLFYFNSLAPASPPRNHASDAEKLDAKIYIFFQLNVNSENFFTQTAQKPFEQSPPPLPLPREGTADADRYILPPLPGRGQGWGEMPVPAGCRRTRP